MIKDIIDSQIDRYLRLFILILLAAITFSIATSLTLTGLWMLGICVVAASLYVFIDHIRAEIKGEKKKEEYRGCCGK